MRRRLLAISVLLLAAAGLGLASASNLSVGSPKLGIEAASNPCPGVVVATPATLSGSRYRGIAFTLPSGCGSRTVQAAIKNGSTWRTGSATFASSGIVTLNNTYTALTTMNVVATVDGWDLPVTWSYAPVTCAVPTGVATCDAGVTIFTGNKPGGGFFTYYDVVVTTTSTTPVPWRVTILMSYPDYPGIPTYLGNSTLDAFNDGQTAWSGTGSINDVDRVSACADSPVLVVAGRPSGPTANRFENVVAGRQRNFSLVLNYNSGPYTDVLSPGCTP